ncbi:MAG: cytochrome c1 [Pseudomonadota bacterium]
MLSLLPTLTFASAESVELLKAPVNLQDKVSLQRGANLFINQCMGCHSLEYIRYERLVTDLGIPPEVVKEQMIFNGQDIGSKMISSMDSEVAAKWFGIVPPDLTLESKLRSPDWIYSYLLAFYPDASRPFGVNNHVFPNVGMPHVLQDMQEKLEPEEFKQAVGDLTNFLTYSSDPTKLSRERIGTFVLIFLAILFVPVWFLNREYWKDVK